jgi:hypothetical protein
VEEGIMRRTLATLAIASLAVFFLTPNAAYGAKIELLKTKTVNFQGKAKLESVPHSICVTQTGLFIIPQPEKGEIGIFNILKKDQSEFLNRKMGIEGIVTPRENTLNSSKKHAPVDPVIRLKKPGYSSLDPFGKVYCIADIANGKKNKAAYIYSVNGDSFDLVKRVEDVDAYDLAYWEGGNSLVVSGYLKEGRTEYELYAIGLNGTEKTTNRDDANKRMLLEAHKKYGYSVEEYNAKYDSDAIPALGIRAFIDVQANYVYFTYEAGMRILKINLHDPENVESFGEKTQHYIEPVATRSLIKAYKDHDIATVLTTRARMSFIRDIWATPDHVVIVYKGANSSPESNYRLQVYTTQGEFLGDEAVVGDPYHRMWFDKESYKLYFLSKDSKFDDLKIKEYKLSVEK